MNPLLPTKVGFSTRLSQPFGKVAQKLGRNLSSDWKWAAVHKQIHDHFVSEEHDIDDYVLGFIYLDVFFNHPAYSELALS